MAESIYAVCGECDFGSENHNDLVNHVLTVHTNYTLEEAESYVTAWEESAWEELEAHNAYRTDFYKTHGVDPDKMDRDD